MPRGGSRPGAGRPRKNPEAPAKVKKPRAASTKKTAEKGFTAPDGLKTTDAPANWPFGVEPEKPKADVDPENDDGLTDEQRAGLSPLDYLLAVMRSPEASKSARMQAAIQAAPYIHAKPAPAAKKEAAKEKAKQAGTGKFKAAPAPLKLVAGGK